MIDRSLRVRTSAAGVLVLALAHPLAAQRQTPAQRGGPPRAETPQLVVGVLESSDRRIGVAAADAIRKRMQSEHNATDIYLTPAPTIEETLKLSGYPADSALGQSDLLLLAKQLRGDYALAGTVEKTASGMRTSIRLISQRGPVVVAEPIAPVLGSDIGDIAKQVDRAVSEALHALSFHRDCMNALVVGDYARAMAAAQQGLKIRPTSAAINQCVLSTLHATHASPDSIVAVATAITAVDSANTVAWANLTDAYMQKGDSARAFDAERSLHRLDPGNADVTSDLVDRFVNAGQPQSALALLDTALAAAPTNAAFLRKKWLIEVRIGQYAAALTTGRALIAADSTAATVDYFERQLAVAKAANDSAATRGLALAGSARFPKNVNFLLTLARDAVDRGPSPEALGLLERAIAVEPANSIAWQLAIAAHAKTNGADSAVAAARRALAAGVEKEPIGTSLLAIIRPTLAVAQSTQKRADWELVLHTALAVDSVASTPHSNFYVGVAAYQVASDELPALSAFATKRTPTRVERQAACESSTRTEGLVSTVTIALPKGGSVDPTIAGKILSALPAMSEFVTSVKQASCRVRPDE